MTRSDAIDDAGFDELAIKHGQLPKPPTSLFRSAPTTGPIILSGIASTSDDIDLERIGFAPRAFEPRDKYIPLRYDHTDAEAGTIEFLAYNARNEPLADHSRFGRARTGQTLQRVVDQR
jgi:hypothetical protein